MLFINWWLLGEITLALLMIAAGVIGFSKAGSLHRKITRRGLTVVCIPVTGLGILLGLLFLLTMASGSESVSPPIYSPSGRVAVRVYYFDDGATGAASSVKMFWARGIRQATIFSAPWEAVEPADVQWISDSELRIKYGGDAPADEIYCGSTTVVKIVCMPK